MRLGLFGSAQARRGGSAGDAVQGFRDYVDLCVEAEALGFHASFLVEHHFTGMGQVSDSLGLLGWVGAATRTLRLGTAVVVLPWHDPVLLAERAATLDLMSGGRLDFGAGRGYRHTEFTGFCMDATEADGRFEEALGLIRRAWTSEARFSHQGRYWRYHDIIVEPPPAQAPHPPIWIAAGRHESIVRVAALGANLLLDQFASVAEIGERIALFRREVEAQGRRFDAFEVAVARNVYVATGAADRAAALERQAQAHQRMLTLSRRPDGANASHIVAYADRPGGTEASALYGTPDEVAAGLRALAEAGAAYVLVNGGADVRGVIRRLAREVMGQLA